MKALKFVSGALYSEMSSIIMHMGLVKYQSSLVISMNIPHIFSSLLVIN